MYLAPLDIQNVTEALRECEVQNEELISRVKNMAKLKNGMEQPSFNHVQPTTSNSKPKLHFEVRTVAFPSRSLSLPTPPLTVNPMTPSSRQNKVQTRMGIRSTARYTLQ